MYKLKITKEVEDEITYLHNQYPETEWSGVLALTFDEVEDNIIFETLGIYPMDVGSSASTSFSYKEEIINIYNYFNSKTSKKYILGTIHTHHNMNAFISGTDLNEIKSNVNIFNNYLFLVVDIKKSYVAKFARKKIIEIKSESFLDFNNNKKYNNILEDKKIDTVIYDVEIEYPFNRVSKEFEKLVKSINPNNKIKNSFPITPVYSNIPTYNTFKTSPSFKNSLELNKTVKLNDNQKALMLLLSSSLEDVFSIEEDMYSIIEYYNFIEDYIEINFSNSKITLNNLRKKVIEAYNEFTIFNSDSLSINQWINGIIKEIEDIKSNSKLIKNGIITKETVEVLTNLSALLTKLKGNVYEY